MTNPSTSDEADDLSPAVESPQTADARPGKKRGDRENLVSEKSVARACEAVRAAGENVTTTRVRAVLGGGSPNDILPLVNEWKLANKPKAPTIGEGSEKPVEKKAEVGRQIVNLETFPLVSGSLDALTHAFLDAMRNIQDAERNRADEQIRTMQETSARQTQAERERAEAVIAENAAVAASDVLDAQLAEKEMAAQYSNALEEIDLLQAQQEDFEKVREELKAEAERANKNEKAANAFRHELSQMKAERDQLVADLESSRNRVRELTEDRTEQNKRYKEVVDERDRTKAAEAKLAEELAQVRGRVEALHDQVTEAKSALARTEAQRDSALERLEECRAERKADRKAEPSAP